MHLQKLWEIILPNFQILNDREIYFTKNTLIMIIFDNFINCYIYGE